MRFAIKKKTFSIAVAAMVASLLVLVTMNTTARPANVNQDVGVLRMAQSIPLPGVKGRIDHIATDIGGQRLFIAALGNDTLEIVDLRSGKRIHSITGLHEPQDVTYVPEINRIFVSNGASGSVSIFDSRSLRYEGNITFREDADNLRYDARSKYLYVGYGKGSLGVTDVMSGKIIGDIRLAGHPEAFQLESKGPRIFVNIPSARQVAVVDRDKRSVIAVLPLKDSGNFPMALDEKRHRLFIGCRRPATMLVYDTESGREVARIDIGRDVDDISYDPVHRQIYTSCGEGFIDVIRQTEADHYEVTARLKTARGARTSRFEPESMLFYLAVPSESGKSAEIRVYDFLTK